MAGNNWARGFRDPAVNEGLFAEVAPELSQARAGQGPKCQAADSKGSDVRVTEGVRLKNSNKQ